jgi:DMSO reductase anchor subunit
MVYADTRREFWRLPNTGARFFGTVAMLGSSTTLVVGTALQLAPEFLRAAAISSMVASLLKLGVEARFLRDVDVDLNDVQWTPLQRSVLLMTGTFGWLSRGRIGLTLIGGLLLPGLWLMNGNEALLFIVFALCLLAEFIERYLFFVTVASAKMPGGM